MDAECAQPLPFHQVIKAVYHHFNSIAAFFLQISLDTPPSRDALHRSWSGGKKNKIKSKKTYLDT